MNPIRSLSAAVLVLVLAATRVFGQAQGPGPEVPEGIGFRAADILSEGTRMAAEAFGPRDPEPRKLPTIVMSHGWGGTAAALRPDAIAFARAGYLVIAFDYRGWGKS